jgi:hypothetical protein
MGRAHNGNDVCSRRPTACCCRVGQDVGRLEGWQPVGCGVKPKFGEATGVDFSVPRLHRNSAHSKHGRQEPTLDEDMGFRGYLHPVDG